MTRFFPAILAMAAGAALSSMPAQAQSSDAMLRDSLVTANRILSHVGIVDAFGHISARSVEHKDRMLISRSLAPELVSASDIIEVDITSCEPVGKGAIKTYLERFIHCSIYRARPEVRSIVHSHSPSVIPFGATGKPLRPIYHMSGFLGRGAPTFEIRQSAGNASDMLVSNAGIGDALAATLDRSAVVVMRGHGSTAVGETIEQVVYRAIYTEKNAQLQLLAEGLGPVTFLNEQEAEAAARSNDGQIARPWALWKKKAFAQEGTAAENGK